MSTVAMVDVPFGDLAEDVAARALASALGDGWTDGVQRGSSQRYVTHTDGSAFNLVTYPDNYLVPKSQRGRLFIVGLVAVPLVLWTHVATTGSISVSQRRTPRQIAADIERRMMPQYREAIASHEAQATRLQEEVAAREALATKVATAVGAHRISGPSVFFGSHQDLAWTGTATVRGFTSSAFPDVVRFKVNVPPDQAVAFAEYLAAQFPADETDDDNEAEPGFMQTSCRHCELDIEGQQGDDEWRDRGNNTRCNDGEHAHAPS